MGQPARIVTEIRDFPGLVTAADPHDLAAGAAEEQLNVQSGRAGTLEVRPGYKTVTFEDE